MSSIPFDCVKNVTCIQVKIKEQLHTPDLVELKVDGKKNTEDLELVVRAKMEELMMREPDADRTCAVKELLDRAQGLFVYVGRVLEDRDTLTLCEVREFPKGMKDFIVNSMHRMKRSLHDDRKWDDVIRCLQIIFV